MADNFCDGSGFREAVCIDAARVYDSCSDKDCLRDLRVVFPEAIQRSVIDNATGVKVKNVSVLNVLIDVETLPFNKGFYAVNMTYYFEVTAEVTTPKSPCCTVVGFATAEKKAILFGSDGNVRVFRSDREGEICEDSNMPLAKVQVVDPICLSSCLVASREAPCPISIPDCICEYFKCACFGRQSPCSDDYATPSQDLYITLGLFSIILLERRASMLMPCIDFCIPDKDCSACSVGEQTPCELFEQIKFPTDEFFPPKLDFDTDCSCGC